MRSTGVDWKKVQAGALVAAFLITLVPAPASADEMGGGGFAVVAEEEIITFEPACVDSMRAHAGFNLAALVGTFAYGPAKTVLAILGTTAAGISWVFTLGNNTVARNVAGPALMGDYVLTCEHMTGQEPIEFFGQGPF